MSAALRDGRLADLSILAHPALARALALLNDRGEEARLVGGAVRDLLLGQTPVDFDLATTATPDVVIARARAAGIAYAPTGVKHGTVTLILAGSTIEATTLREDVETDGRHAKVKYGRDFDADARRRDFTINALSLDVEGRVHDAVGGLADLEERRVRFIGDPRQRIREDYLRILRLLRFSARFGEGRLDRESLAAAIAERHGLTTLSSERVRAELLKILIAAHGPRVLQEASDAGLIGILLHGVAYPARLHRLAAIETALGVAPDARLRLAAFAVGVREDVERLRERLRLSNAECEGLEHVAAALEASHGRALAPSFRESQTLLFAHGREGAVGAIRLAHAESRASPDDASWLAAHRAVSDMAEPRLPFTGADLLGRGMSPGRAIGKALKTLQALWIRAGFPREPETLARLLDEALSSQTGDGVG